MAPRNKWGRESCSSHVSAVNNLIVRHMYSYNYNNLCVSYQLMNAITYIIICLSHISLRDFHPFVLMHNFHNFTCVKNNY